MTACRAECVRREGGRLRAGGFCYPFSGMGSRVDTNGNRCIFKEFCLTILHIGRVIATLATLTSQNSPIRVSWKGLSGLKGRKGSSLRNISRFAVSLLEFSGATLCELVYWKGSRCLASISRFVASLLGFSGATL